MVNVTGSHTFSIPSYAQTDDINAVMDRIETDLPAQFDFQLEILVRCFLMSSFFLFIRAVHRDAGL
jgi:hypothetical protein